MWWIISQSDGISFGPIVSTSGRFTIDTSHFWTPFSGKPTLIGSTNAGNTSVSISFRVSCRYEIEYDQTRLEISKEIARKFLGFDIKEDGTATSASKDGDEGGGGGGGGGDGDENHRVTSNSTTPSGKDKGEQHIGRNEENGEDDGPVGDGGNKLVLDVLNDELVERVREKMLSGSKDLYEACQSSVKSFLAGEPFQEFQHSMYFHRWAGGGRRAKEAKQPDY